MEYGGGIIVMDVTAFSIVDKLEIIHDGVKKATTSMNPDGNFGPFDDTDIITADQFIGRNKGSVPTRVAQFEADTGINSYFVTSNYQQVVWWVYDQDDYNKNSIAQVRVGAPTSGTQWKLFRRCDITLTPPPPPP
ncbi:hypothetical protein EB169_13430, partial [archaeon]|nr:hypothetical protein [archaeon]